MKWQTCFSSKCDSGYDICMVKSAMQKFLRRRMASQMKWCVLEMYKFKSMASNEKEVKIGKGILSNLINRIIIMLDEELLFKEWQVYLKARNLIEKFSNDNSKIEYLYEICDILCESKLLRYSSDVSCYYSKGVIGMNDNCNYNLEKIEDSLVIYNKFKSTMENNLVEEMFYWAFELFINKNDNKLERKVLKRSTPVYLIWEYLLNSKKVKDNVNLRKSIEYRFDEFHKERGEKKMFMVAALSLYIYSDNIDWEIDWENVKAKNCYNLIEEKIVIPDFAIDMHCRQGRMMGKNQADFAKEGSFVVDEDKEYYSEAYRAFYNNCKMEDASKGVKKEKKVVVKKDKKDQIKKKILIIEEDSHSDSEEEICLKKEKKVVIKKAKKEKYVAKLPKKDELDFISMNDFKFISLCTKTTCGRKAMCFIVEYNGQEYVLKEGRKSMNYNEDYEVIDSMKEIFGLNTIGMKRIFSDKIIKKIDSSIKDWTDNWQFVNQENTVYSMMSYIKGSRFNKAEKITEDMNLEYMKIGLFRGIFGISDFNVTNVFVLGDKLYSMDEHDILGKREKMIGEKNMRFYKKYDKKVKSIFDDLYKDKEVKKQLIIDILNKFNYRQFAKKVLENYDNLREKFYEEYFE